MAESPEPTASPEPTGHLSPADIPAALELLDVETAKLLATVETLTDEDLAQPSLCPGWTRGHIVTHLARNAESLVRLVVWARTGVRTPQYPSQASRDADIEEGAPRPAADQLADLSRSCDLVRDGLAALALPLATHELQMSSGPADPRDLPRRRLNEVVLHHLDLRAGFTLDDAHPLAIADLLDLAVSRLARPGGPKLSINSHDGDHYLVGTTPSETVADGVVAVQGSASDLLQWLTRGVTDRVDSTGPLPTLP
ncbi:MAG: maleylpyruvate isomerase family mycothiol-dependent enzyme [Austwickia sp.]|jgi:maleylpyruvate isomerase|nr:MAG: maleylpyruvate isomerase family mycothiol-dependent enzyme [Austwickia sp.]